MRREPPTLQMICGKVAAGKSTLCRKLAAAPDTIVIAQDHWMSSLYPDELRTVPDYICLVPRVRAAIGPHIVELLGSGISIVLDWPANTVESRAWMRSLFEAAEVGHVLHVLEVSDEVCLSRLRARNADGSHPYRVSDEDFASLTRYFEVPRASEGFATIVHSG